MLRRLARQCDSILGGRRLRRSKLRLYERLFWVLTDNWVLAIGNCPYPFFNSISTCRAISFSVSNTPTP
jgi:hypothetical protein